MNDRYGAKRFIDDRELAYSNLDIVALERQRMLDITGRDILPKLVNAGPHIVNFEVVNRADPENRRRELTLTVDVSEVPPWLANRRQPALQNRLEAARMLADVSDDELAILRECGNKEKPEALAIYADWLDEHGRSQEAAYIRRNTPERV